MRIGCFDVRISCSQPRLLRSSKWYDVATDDDIRPFTCPGLVSSPSIATYLAYLSLLRRGVHSILLCISIILTAEPLLTTSRRSLLFG